ncbi:tRNA lysidine(34) synthetase TilS [Leucobacter sp. CSA1]|uniref:tRNA(Ile)-lysidine synthase n=1 Tax=Leucobacter chromiisoli TaxID=2796471 RepID=A0A934Q3M8_9MICO|nr:tRNA lysidine(34) synthetase TilS [Leucobacter chromiisoli]MBK0417779.1 tRNA lysidine(34) synthetase TilS [Leucobacter chromiisoli]
MTRLPRLNPAVARTRRAVREALAGAGSAPGAGEGLVLVALSGGADSLALAAAVAFEAPRLGLEAGAAIVDHGLQPDSAGVSEEAAAAARGLGLDPVTVERVSVPGNSEAGPEGAAREARYAALEGVRSGLGARLILTAHTRDDQAEQVLLALARGSGARSLAGIPRRRGPILRPFLELDRSTTEAACAAQGLSPWRDPHNSDAGYARVRVRDRILPVLEAELGPGIAAALARTAELAREDAEAFDDMVAETIEEIVEPAEAGIAVSVAALAANPAALRHRLIRAVAAAEFGSHLSREHTLAISALVTDWRGQGPIHVPGISVARSGGLIVFTAHR